MRRANTKALLVGFVAALGLLVGSGVAQRASAQVVQKTGLTVTPAALTVDLPAGALESSATLQVTNHYATPVTLSFRFETDAGAKDAVLNQLLLGNPEVTLASGQTIAQTISLFDSQDLPPGGQQISLLIQQQSQATAGSVGVSASMRLPLTIIKESGAITRLSLTSLTGPSITIGLPKSISATLHNTGNMIAIPHGTVKINNGDGTVLSQGTLNVASQAMAPGQSSSFTTTLTSLRHPALPGIYHVQFSYGLGADYKPQVVSVGFVYVAWWHIVVLILLGTGVYGGVRNLRRARSRLYLRKKAKRGVLFARRGTA